MKKRALILGYLAIVVAIVGAVKFAQHSENKKLAPAEKLLADCNDPPPSDGPGE